MRRLRPLLLLAIVVILAAVGGLYYVQRGVERRQSPAKPKPLPPNTTSTSPGGWELAQVDEKGVAVVRIRAEDMRESTEPPRLYLTQVEVRLLDKDGVSFDRIKTDSAEFNQKDGTLYADGDVEITTGEPVGDAATNRRQVHIRTSGLTFDRN